MPKINNLDKILNLAVQELDFDLIEMSIKKGAKLNKAEYFSTILSKRPDMLKKVADLAPDKKILKRIGEGEYIGKIIYDLLKKDKTILDKLDEAGINYRKDIGARVIAYAMDKKDFDIVKFLIEDAKCDVNPSKKTGFITKRWYNAAGKSFDPIKVPLMQAFLIPQEDERNKMIDYLLKNGAKLNAVKGEFINAMSIIRDQKACVYLMKNGVKMNDKAIAFFFKEDRWSYGNRPKYKPTSFDDEFIMECIKQNPNWIKNFDKYLDAGQKKKFDMYVKLGVDFDLFDDD